MPVPDPEPGLVICYRYLWHHEHRAGWEEDRKDRPSVIVFAVERDIDGITVVTVLPITHRAPSDPTAAVEIPLPVKRHLGLDAERSWIIVNEGNEFLWPGYDLRRVRGSGRFDYGFLPPRLFDRVIRAFVACHRAGRRRVTSRE